MAKTSGSEGRSRLARPLIALVLLTAPAFAQDDRAKNAARELAVQAQNAMNKGDYATAQDLYLRAYTLVPAPTISLRRARALVKLGRWVEAVESYVRTVRTEVSSSSPAAFRDAVRDGAQELASLRPRLPQLTVVLDGADPKDSGLEIKLDGKAFSTALVGVSSPVDPGQHELEVKAGDGRKGSARFAVAEAEKKSVTLSLSGSADAPATAPAEGAEPAKPEVIPHPDRATDARPSQTQKTLAFVSLGVGAAGVGVGVVTGLMAASKHSSAESACPGGRCVEGSSGADDADAFRRLRTISTVGYVVGVVGIGAGVTLWLTAPKQGDSARIGAFVGTDRVGVKGSF